MRLNESNVEKIDAILRKIANGRNISEFNKGWRELKITANEYERYKGFILAHGFGEINGMGNLQGNTGTLTALHDNAVRAMFDEQESAIRRQDGIDAERKYNTNNAKWAKPISIATLIIALLTLFVSVVALLT